MAAASSNPETRGSDRPAAEPEVAPSQVAPGDAHAVGGTSRRAAERYRRLPAGTHGLNPEEVERDQRRRLQAAIIELIAERGYPAVRMNDLIKLAHVSRPKFYELYADKEDLLISAYDEIAARAGQAISEVGAGSPMQRLERMIRALGELAAAEPDAMSLFLLGAFGAGAKTLERRRASLERFERAIELSRQPGALTPTADLTTKIILGGICEVTVTRLREHRASELPGLASELAAWAASYPPALPPGVASSPAVRRKLSETRDLASERARRAQGRLPSGRHDLPRDYVVKNQRERIVDATAAIVAEKGLAALTIPEIASRANVSHETFYRWYPTKQDAFLGAQKVGMQQAFRIALEAYDAHRRDAWSRGVAEAVRALIAYLHSEPAHAHLSIVDTFALSPQTLTIRDGILRGFASYLGPRERPPAGDVDVPAVAAEALVGGIWEVLHHYVENGSFDELLQATQQLIYLTLAPFIGSEEAAKEAQRSPARDESRTVGE